MKPRTRFAPSPTGYLHVGGIRTALFAWLIAQQGKGSFLLRIEDTDKAREVAGASQHIIDSLLALGLVPDNCQNPGDQPYYQSQHLDSYKKWAQKLVDAGLAYADPYTPEEVQAFREQAQKDKKPFLYRNHRPDTPPKWDGSQPLRLKTDPREWRWHDAVMGDLHAGPETQDDFIIIKSDGYPTYNFAHIVDDAEMEITHVIRGQEFLASTPNYLNLYRALNLEAPILATMPHILGPDGKKKLSKRDGAKDVLDYIRDGYLPDALVSFIATLGWNDGTTKETFSRQELIDSFTLSQVGRSGAHFDERRLQWVNGVFIRNLAPNELYQKATNFWPAEAASYDDAYKKAVLGLVQERLKYLSELPQLTNFFFSDLPVDLNLITTHKQLKKVAMADLTDWLQQAIGALQNSDFSTENLQQQLNQLLESTHQKPAVLFSLIRIATTWAPASPGLAETLHVLGKERALARLKVSQTALGST